MEYPENQRINFNVMIKPVGARCNLECAYCYYLRKGELYPNRQAVMSREVLEAFTKSYIDACRGPEIVFNWQGGEPLLSGMGFFREAVALQEKYRREDIKIINTIQTNGTLLNDEWCKFLKEEDFLVGVSVDGPEELHNTFRRDKTGKGTFERVMTGLDYLRKNEVEFNILSAVHAENEKHPLEVYRFLSREIGCDFIQFIPIVERQEQKSGTTLLPYSVSAQKYGEFLATIFDEWVRNDVGKVFVQIFDVTLGAWLGQPGGLCEFAATCGSGLALEQNGDLYACDHFVEADFLLGNIMEQSLKAMVVSEKQAAFGKDKMKTLANECLTCRFRFACHGGCQKNRFENWNGNANPGNYLCEGYKVFFEHVQQAMTIMADLIHQGQAPARIMEILKL